MHPNPKFSGKSPQYTAPPFPLLNVPSPPTGRPLSFPGFIGRRRRSKMSKRRRISRRRRRISRRRRRISRRRTNRRRRRSRRR